MQGKKERLWHLGGPWPLPPLNPPVIFKNVKLLFTDMTDIH